MHSVIEAVVYGWHAYARDYETAGPRPAPTPVAVVLGFDQDNPAAVQVSFHDHTWTFDRALLRAAVTSDAPSKFGEGHVCVGRTSLGIAFELKGQGEGRLIVLNYSPTAWFMSSVDACVPPGTEAYDVDAWITELQGGAS